MNRIILFAFMLVLTFASCKNEKKSSEVKEIAATEEISDTKYKVYPFSPSTSYDNAHIEKMTYKNGNFSFQIPEGEYELGSQTPDADQKMCANSSKGQHIHVIVDNTPYAAKYDANFEYEIEDGEHSLLTFLSRSYHESIKVPSAKTASMVTIKNNSIIGTKEITEPSLFYSRPKGTYIGKPNSDKVMLDFYIMNVELGNDYKVQADINGEIHILDKWQPYYIEGLPIGRNTINLKLVDGNGVMIESPINDVTRTFELMESIEI